ncbi:MAG: hypothetical protein ACR2JW_03755 [Thermomicrobiales bacterium]
MIAAHYLLDKLDTEAGRYGGDAEVYLDASLDRAAALIETVTAVL